MYEVWIIVFCFIRSVIVRYFFNNKNSQASQVQDVSNKNQPKQNEKIGQPNTTQSALQIQLKQCKDKKRQIEQTMQQFNTPSTFAKYSKMQRQLSKLNNQIQALQTDIVKEASIQNENNQSQPQAQNQRQSLLEQKKKEVQKIHGQIANKTLLTKALTNLALIILCSYIESSQISACVSYPLYTFCNESGRLNGAWIFIFSTVIFSH